MDNRDNTQDKERDHRKSIMRSTLSVAVPTVLSRIMGYFRDVLQAYFLGTSGSADAFTIAYVIPNLLRRLTGEGAMTAAFVPVFTQLKEDKKKEEIWNFANCFFYDLTLIMASLTVIGILLAPVLVKVIAIGFGGVPGKWELTIILTRIMFPYMFLISLAALAMAILNSFRKFFVPAFTPVLFNLAIISAALLFATRAEEPAYVFAAGVVIGGVFQLAFQLPLLWKKGMRFKFGLSFKHPAVKKVGKLMIPGIFGVGISQINFALSRILASSLEEGSVSSLYYAGRVQELTLGVFSIALSIALLPTFSEMVAKKDIPSLKRMLVFSTKLIVFVTAPAMVGLLILNRQIIEVLFQRGAFDAQSTTMSAACLFYFALGLPFLSGVKIFAPAFYSLKDTKTPVIVAFFVMISYLTLSFVLMGSMRVAGIALALSVSTLINFISLFILLERKIGKVGKKEIFVSALKSLLFAGAMGAGVWIFIRQFDFSRLEFLAKLGILGAAICIGLAVYFFLNLLFNPQDLRSLKDVFSREKILKDEEMT